MVIWSQINVISGHEKLTRDECWVVRKKGERGNRKRELRAS